MLPRARVGPPFRAYFAGFLWGRVTPRPGVEVEGLGWSALSGDLPAQIFEGSCGLFNEGTRNLAICLGFWGGGAEIMT
jgi:hypothetical protein